MRVLRCFCFTLLLALLLILPARAESIRDEVYAESGVDALLEALPDEARELLLSSGFSPENADPNALQSFVQSVSETLRAELSEPLRALGALIASVLLCRIVLELAPEGLQYTVNLCGMLCAGTVLLPCMASLIEQTSGIVQAIGAFLLAAVPVYAGLLVFSGNAVTSSTYGALTLAAGNGISALAVNLFLPLLRVFLALSVTSAVTSFDLKKLTDALYKTIKWVLILAVTIFTSILSIQTLISAQSDAVTDKATKMIASSTIPIVGGAFGDALSVLSASVGLVKSGAGAFGIIASFAIFLPVCLRAVVWLMVCFGASFAADLFDLHPLAIFLEGCSVVLKLLLAIMFSIGAVSAISAAVMLCVRGAYG